MCRACSSGLPQWLDPKTEETFKKLVEGSRLGYSSQRPTCSAGESYPVWNGEWILEVNASLVGSLWGMAFGRVDTKFSAGYKVYPLRPGIYYFMIETSY